MPYTSAQHQQNRVYAALGYKILDEGVLLSEFQVGEGIIILNRKGEPMMSGLIEKLYQVEGESCVDVGGTCWPSSTYLFRKM